MCVTLSGRKQEETKERGHAENRKESCREGGEEGLIQKRRRLGGQRGLYHEKKARREGGNTKGEKIGGRGGKSKTLGKESFDCRKKRKVELNTNMTNIQEFRKRREKILLSTKVTVGVVEIIPERPTQGGVFHSLR